MSYLGIRTLLSKEGLADSGKAAPAMLRSVFFQGVATNVLNPKVAPFFLAFFCRSSLTRTRAARPCNC